MITAKASGKLYIAGEYAVVEKGYPAIIASINKYVTVSIAKSKSDKGSLNSDKFTDSLIYWSRENNRFKIDNRDNQLEFIISAINTVEIYAKELGTDLSVYNIKISSELDSKDGKKYGLGSSAAVTVATVTALCEYYNIQMTPIMIFKLAAIAHLKVQGNGSLGDIASSTFGGLIYYTSPNINFILQSMLNKTITEIIHEDWPNLIIKNIDMPKNSKLLVGWTGKPASTSILIDQISYSKSQKEQLYSEFLINSKKCINDMLNGFTTGNLNTVQNQININRNILNKLSTFTDVEIETKRLSKLCEIATNKYSAAKTSGAGGGDCGIAITLDSPEIISNIKKNWEENNIIYLNLSITNRS